MNEIERSINKSSRAFMDVVWPVISKYIGGGDIVPVEGVTDESMAQKFDTISGIDAWQITDKGIRGIASRVQPQGKSWDTFTIRRSLVSGQKTEWHKRVETIFSQQQGSLYPAVTVQAYMNFNYTEPLYSVACIHTIDLYRAAMLHDDWRVQSVQGGNKMLIIDWDKLADRGFRIKIWRKEG
jgi:hypothetical protein